MRPVVDALGGITIDSEVEFTCGEDASPIPYHFVRDLMNVMVRWQLHSQEKDMHLLPETSSVDVTRLQL